MSHLQFFRKKISELKGNEMISRKLESCGPTCTRCHSSPRTYIPCCSSMVSLNLLEGKPLRRGSFLESQRVLWGPSVPCWPPMVRIPLPGAGLVYWVGTGAHGGCPWWAGKCSLPGTPHLLFQTTQPRHSFCRAGEKLWGCREMVPSRQWEQQPSLSPASTALPSRGYYMNKVQKCPKLPCFPFP